MTLMMEDLNLTVVHLSCKGVASTRQTNQFAFELYVSIVASFRLKLVNRVFP